MRGVLRRLAELVAVGGLRGQLFRREKRRLAGTWESVYFEAGGRPLTAEEARARAITLCFDEDGVSLVQAGRLRGTYLLDPRPRPRALDLRLGLAVGTLTLRAIYALDGDTLTMHLGGLDGQRPTAFVTMAGMTSQVIHFRRRVNASRRESR
jgi:uncharacterized protein (TIGR03067 family)